MEVSGVGKLGIQEEKGESKGVGIGVRKEGEKRRFGEVKEEEEIEEEREVKK